MNLMQHPGTVFPDFAKVAFAFDQYLSGLPKPKVYETCKAAYQTLPAA